MAKRTNFYAEYHLDGEGVGCGGGEGGNWAGCKKRGDEPATLNLGGVIGGRVAKQETTNTIQSSQY